MSVGRCVATLTPLAPGTTAAPDAVRFESRGAVLVMGDDASIAQAVEAVARHHPTAAFAPGIDAIRIIGRVTTVGSRVGALQGRLGAFRGQVRGPAGMQDIGAASPNRDGLFDLVLDLGQQPLMALDIAPLGYFAPGADPAARAHALQAMRTLVGTFTKPRYFRYQAEWCAHGASGLTGCTRCIEICSAAAITSAGNEIRVDPYLCQGCAACTLACPTGALSFALPIRETLHRHLAQTLRSPQSPQPVLVALGSSQIEAVQRIADTTGALTMTVDPLPAFGDELWFEAFALGAKAVALVDEAGLAPASRALIGARVAQSRVVLKSLGIAPHRLGFMPIEDLSDWLGTLAGHSAGPRGGTQGSASREPTAPAMASARVTKRVALLDTIDRLGARGPACAPSDLPVGACFGEVVVDRKRCTLCFACANLCPTGALSSDDGGTPRLRFAEDACVQCGLCERGCPEKAVLLRPRFKLRGSNGGTARVLNEDELLACTTCGTPFIGRKLLASSLERIKDHPVLAQGGRERFMTCPTCRQVALLQT